MSAKSWMPFYVADYLADTGHLTTVEHGAYLLLIMHYWQRGSLPADDARLASIARLALEQWLAMRDTIAEFFGPGWRHERIEAESAISAARHERRVNAGKKGGEAKAASSNASPTPVATAKQSPPQPQPQPQKKEKKESCPKPKKVSAYQDDFEAFWRAYPTDPNMSKSEAAKAWAKLPPDDRELCLASCPSFAAFCKKDPTYRPLHAVRFITQERFRGFAEAVADRAKIAHSEPVIASDIDAPEWTAACLALVQREGVDKFNAWFGLGKLTSAKPYKFEVQSGFVAQQCKTYFEQFLEDQLGARVQFVVAKPKAVIT